MVTLVIASSLFYSISLFLTIPLNAQHTPSSMSLECTNRSPLNGIPFIFYPVYLISIADSFDSIYSSAGIRLTLKSDVSTKVVDFCT